MFVSLFNYELEINVHYVKNVKPEINLISEAIFSQHLIIFNAEIIPS
jgi:hypothetical protein